ncbi:MAG: hypothetical protein R3B46_10415 [Phycisphaerales bacterium]
MNWRSRMIRRSRRSCKEIEASISAAGEQLMQRTHVDTGVSERGGAGAGGALAEKGSAGGADFWVKR